MLWSKEESESWKLWRSWTEYFHRQPCHQLSRRSSGDIDADNAVDVYDDNADEENDYDEDSDDDDDNVVQAEGWIAGEGEREVESGPIADDHIYQSA